MNELINKLKKKGWSTKDIYKAMSIITKSENYKPPFIKKIDFIAYWSTFILAIIGNFVISIIFIPFLLVIKTTFLYLIILVVALTFGFLFQLIARDIEKTTPKNYLILGIFIPVIAIINMFYMVRFSNYLKDILNLATYVNNPLIVGIVYVVFFMLPYLIIKIRS